MNVTESIRPYKGEGPYVFVSYAQKDKAKVMGIVSSMQADGYRVWFYEGVGPGTDWDDIVAHVEGCDVFLAMLSRQYLESDRCKSELSYARNLGKPLVLVYLEDVALPQSMKVQLGQLPAIFKDRYGSEAQFYEELYASNGLDRSKAIFSQSGDPAGASPETARFASSLEGEASTVYGDLTAYRKLAKGSRTYLSLAAQSAERLAALLEEQDRGTEATHFYRESLSAYRELAEREPEKYLPAVARLAFATGLSLAGLYDRTVMAHLATGSHEAEDLYRESFEIGKRLAERDPTSYLAQAAQSAHNLAYLLDADGRSDESMGYFRESLAMRRRLAGMDPERYLKDVAVSDTHLARVLARVGQLDEALRLRAEAQSIRQE